MKLLDLHCDTVLHLYEHPEKTLARNDLAVNLETLDKVDSMAQVFALFIDAGKVKDLSATTFAMLRRLREELDRNAETIAWAGCGDDIRRNAANGKKSALIAIEEGGALEGSTDTLRTFHSQGVRFLTLTWNYPNEIGFPHGEEHGHKGLTPFGLSLLEEMNSLGVVADVSHLSEAGFWDVANNSKSPFMATHSNCRALREHTRNLRDDQIKALADKGGVMGISIVKNFLLDGDDVGRLDAMVAHIRHAEKIGGIDVLAIGTDFDGTSTNEEIRRMDDLNKLEPLLRRAGYTDEKLEKLYWKNALRVLDDVL